jgi:hypothetical protein
LLRSFAGAQDDKKRAQDGKKAIGMTRKGNRDDKKAIEMTTKGNRGEKREAL